MGKQDNSCHGMVPWLIEWNQRRAADVPWTATILCGCLALIGLIVVGHALWGWIFGGGGR